MHKLPDVSKMRLSTHFALQEFTFSQTAVRRDIDNTPPIEAIENMMQLCKFVLEPIRIQLNEPIRITSGYRSAELNKAIGGAASSQHLLGMAADIKISSMNAEGLFRFILSLGLEFDQLIQEFDQWVHISYFQDHNRKQAMYAKRRHGITIYEKV